MPFQHPHWQERQTPLGNEICYLPRGGKGFILSFIFSAAILAASLYGVSIFFKWWFLEHAEILAGGAVLFLVPCGGVFLGIHFFRHLFRRVIYTLGPGQLKIVISKFGKSKESFVEKAGVKEMIQLYTPPTSSEPSGSPGSWSTCLVYNDMTGQRKELFLEGLSKEESDYLMAAFSQWAGVGRRMENTTE